MRKRLDDPARPRKAGEEARTLLGGDGWLHVFGDKREAWRLELAIPGSLTWAPIRSGWRNVLDAARERRIPVTDRTVMLEHGKAQRPVALDIAPLLYARGAIEVRDASGFVIEARCR